MKLSNTIKVLLTYAMLFAFNSSGHAAEDKCQELRTHINVLGFELKMSYKATNIFNTKEIFEVERTYRIKPAVLLPACTSNESATVVGTAVFSTPTQNLIGSFFRQGPGAFIGYDTHSNTYKFWYDFEVKMHYSAFTKLLSDIGVSSFQSMDDSSFITLLSLTMGLRLPYQYQSSPEKPRVLGLVTRNQKIYELQVRKASLDLATPSMN